MKDSNVIKAREIEKIFASAPAPQIMIEPEGVIDKCIKVLKSDADDSMKIGYALATLEGIKGAWNV
jgi:hypothetical protein